MGCCAQAVIGGQPEALPWAREQDCPWDHYTGGRLEVLRLAREHGCEWDETAIDAAEESGCRGDNRIRAG